MRESRVIGKEFTAKGAKDAKENWDHTVRPRENPEVHR
jgi:hypothetical protein